MASELTIAEVAALCFKSFQKCLRTSTFVSPRETSQVEDQFARFSLWTANIGVFTPGRASLDHRLREAQEVREVIVGLLEVLDDRIKEWLSYVDSHMVIYPSTIHQHRETENFSKHIQGLASQITLLHRLSNTIRKASSETQNSLAANTFKILDEEGNDAEPLLGAIFANYIRDKFRNIDERILQRLVSTMIVRRKRILYKRSRFRNTALKVQETKPQPRVRPPKYQPQQALVKPQQDDKHNIDNQTEKEKAVHKSQAGVSATTLDPQKFKMASAPSTVSGTKTISLKNHEELPFPTPPLSRVKRRFKKMKKEREKKYKCYIDSIQDDNMSNSDNHDFTTVLQNDLDKYWDECLRAIGEVTCPFCFYAIPALEVNDNAKWKSHVRNDLDAYVCLFEDCNEKEKLFSHSEEWLKHMQEHALRWPCKSKSHGTLVFETRDKYTNHLMEFHKGTFSDAQLCILADRNARTIGPLFESCPFCGFDDTTEGTTTATKIEEHIVGHLRLLALKSLPTYEDNFSESSDGESASSNQISKTHKRSTIENDSEKEIKPTFEDKGEIITADISDDTFLETASPGDFPDMERKFEWGFVTDIYERNAVDIEDDPVLQNLAVEQIYTQDNALDVFQSGIAAEHDSTRYHNSPDYYEGGKKKRVRLSEYFKLPSSRRRRSSSLDVQELADMTLDEPVMSLHEIDLLDELKYNEDQTIQSAEIDSTQPLKEDDPASNYQNRGSSPVPELTPSSSPKSKKWDGKDVSDMSQRSEVVHISDSPMSLLPMMTSQQGQSAGKSIMVNNHTSETLDHQKQSDVIDQRTNTINIEASGIHVQPTHIQSKVTNIDLGHDVLDDMIRRLLISARSSTKTVCLKFEEMTALCNTARELFLSQPMLLELTAPVKIVGDIHGQYTDLIRIFAMCGYPPNTNYLFLGDYVDRGKRGLETILLLLCYKLKYQENFFLLRGNHECANVSRIYGFYDECKRRCNVKLWKTFIDLFNCLPVAAIVSGKIFCVHGGLSPSLAHMDDIREIPRPVDVPDYGILTDLLWSDPADINKDWDENDRGVSYVFGKNVIMEFLLRYGLDLVCRAHMVVEDGYEFFEDRLLVTVFSAPNYCGEFDNFGAVMSVSEDLLCSFELLKPLTQKAAEAAAASSSSLASNLRERWRRTWRREN